MGIKFELNFLMVAWAFVPALMFATKIFRMDAKDRHSLDMRMKHHSSFWVKGNILVEGLERMVLQQASEENVFRGILVNDAENAALHGALLRQEIVNGKKVNFFPIGKAANIAKLTQYAGFDEAAVLATLASSSSSSSQPITTHTMTMQNTRLGTSSTSPSSTVSSSSPSRFPLLYAMGALEGSEVVSSALFGKKSPAVIGSQKQSSSAVVVVPEDSSILLIPDRVWCLAEERFRNMHENRRETPIGFFR